MYANDNGSTADLRAHAAPTPSRGEHFQITDLIVPLIGTGDHTRWPGTDCRIRLKNGLKHFDPRFPAYHLFPEHEAFIDRFQITLGLTGRCTLDDFPQIRETLLSVEGSYPQRGPLLQQNGLRSQRHVNVEVASGRWLFGSVPAHGSSKFFVRPSGLFEFRLTLIMNLNRFLAHHEGRSLDEIEDQHPCEALLIEPGADRPIGVDGNDNLIPVSMLRSVPLPQRSAFVERALRIYCEHVRRLFEIELSLGNELLEVHHPLAFGAVQQAEVCWDLLDPDPLTRVVEIERVAANICSSMDTNVRYQKGLGRDARWLTIPLTDEVRLKVYAKTIERLRIEIAYGPIRQIAARLGVRRGYPIDDLLVVRADAAKRMGRFCRAASPLLLERPRMGDLLEFLGRLLDAGLRENRQTILSMLAWNGGITPAAVPPHVIEGLVRVGVLRAATSVRHGGVKKYPLRAEWRECLEAYLGVD